jgi:hypothetical protein
VDEYSSETQYQTSNCRNAVIDPSPYINTITAKLSVQYIMSKNNNYFNPTINRFQESIIVELKSLQTSDLALNMRAAIQLLTASTALITLVAASPLQRRQVNCSADNVQYARTCTAACGGSVMQQVRCMKQCTEDIDTEEYVSRCEWSLPMLSS